ncbi:MAG TPA: hypothetical protein VGO78_27165 [Acidimicrobiales bacterium]|nr:hypothetical protein [Acidimicrobiales bacterium]
MTMAGGRRGPRLTTFVTGAALALATVGVSTGAVAAASPEGPAALAAPLPLSIDEVTSPAATSLAPGRTDLFFRLANGHLAYRYRLAGGSWSRRLDLGGSIASQPTVVATGAGRVHVFARGTDDRLAHRSAVNGSWSAWESLDGALTSAPAVTSWGSGRLDVVARGPANALQHRSFTSAGGWSAWRAIGGAFTSSPAVAATAVGRFHVFARGRDQGIRHRSFDQVTGWTPWEDLGGHSAAQPAAVSAGPGLLDVMVRASDPSGSRGLPLVVSRFDGATATWTPWTSLGGALRSGPAAMRTGTGTAVRLLAMAPDGLYREIVRPTPTGAWGAYTRIDPLLPFQGLGTWVDVFDYATLDPATAVPAMRDRGVRTLYLSTARFNGTTDLFDAVEAGQWLDAAHANGLKVVGWYLPAYGNMARDVNRTVAISTFVSPGGQRFDAVGVDIERLDEVTLAQFNTLLVTHLAQVRARTDAMIAAIPPSPFGTQPGNRWAGFPWAGMAAQSDVVVPMILWSFRSNADGTPFTAAQVRDYVFTQAQAVRSLTGDRPMSVEGGVDDPGTEATPVTPDRVQAFVSAVINAGAIGRSHYDYATTAAALWPILDGPG